MEVFKIPQTINDSKTTAVISEINLYHSLVFKNNGKINHKYGNVAIDVIIPVRMISFNEIVSFLNHVLERINKTMVSIVTVKTNDLRKFIS